MTYTGFNGKKVLTGKTLDADEFYFNIEAVGNAPAPVYFLINNAQNGTIVFLNDTVFSAEGEYKYIIREVNGLIPGYIFDASEYEVTVTVTKSAQNVLSAQVTKVAKDGTVIADADDGPINTIEEIVFSNVWQTTVLSTEDLPAGTKTLTGRAMKNNEFEFTLTPVSTNAPPALKTLALSAPASADGTAVSIDLESAFEGVKFAYSEFPYVYTLTEVNSGDSILGVNYDASVFEIYVTVTVDNDGSLSAEAVIKKNSNIVGSADFANDYSSSAQLTLTGQKTLTGNKVLSDQQFEFTLSGQDGTEPMPAVLTAKNTAAGAVSFGPIQFTAADAGTEADPKVYYYSITETNAGQTINGISYDSSAKLVKVEVYDDGLGNLTVKVDKQNASDPDFVFTNSYTASPLSLKISGAKVLNGRSLEDGLFKFEMTRSINGVQTVIATAENKADGTVEFSEITFDAPGTYPIYVYEVNESKPGYTYDTRGFSYDIVVTDNGEGRLVTSYQPSDFQFSFVNYYTAQPVTVSLGGAKVLQGRSLKANEFSFELKDGTGNVIAQAENDASGWLRFPDMTYTDAGTYVYYVSEKAGTEAGVKYDNTVYTVTVTVTDPGEGTLKADLTVTKNSTSGVSIVFTNEYKDPSPQTGDTSNTALWILMSIFSAAGAAALTVFSKKQNRKRQGR